MSNDVAGIDVPEERVLRFALQELATTVERTEAFSVALTPRERDDGTFGVVMTDSAQAQLREALRAP